MAFYLLATFEPVTSLHDLRSSLSAACPFFRADDDWHQYRENLARQAADRIRNAAAVNEEAVIQSIREASIAHGPALYARLQLRSGEMIDGSLYSSGMLLASRDLGPSIVGNDANIGQLHEALAAFCMNLTWETG